MKQGMSKNFFSLKLIIAIASVTVTASVFALFLHGTAEANNVVADTIPKAVIIDQLYDDDPHDWFHQKALKLLEGAGYHVDIFTTKDITVDFYKKLALQNYKIVLVRSHGVADQNDQNSVALFTGEKYTTDKYISEQLFGQIKKGAPLEIVDFLANGTDSQWVKVNDTYSTLTFKAKSITKSDQEYFLITPTFVDTAMEGKFSQTIFVLGGCSTMRTDTMAQALVRHGALSVAGWDNTIGSFDNDVAMTHLLEKLLVDKMKMNDAVSSVMQEYPIEEMAFPASLKSYSES